MAQDTITKVIHIETNYADAVRGIEEYTAALEDVKQAEQDSGQQGRPEKPQFSNPKQLTKYKAPEQYFFEQCRNQRII